MEDRKFKLNKRQKFLLFFILAITYNIWPIDIIPDIMPIVGSIDDAIVKLVPLISGYRAIGASNDVSN